MDMFNFAVFGLFYALFLLIGISYFIYFVYKRIKDKQKEKFEKRDN